MSVIQSEHEFLVNYRTLDGRGNHVVWIQKRSAHSRDQLKATFNSLVAGVLDGDFKL